MVEDNQYYTVSLINFLNTKDFANLKQFIIKKTKSVLNTMPFHFEVDNHKNVNFFGEKLTFTLQLIKI